jgi:hypothetical protein
MLNVICAKCHKVGLYAECHYAECRDAECLYPKCCETNTTGLVSQKGNVTVSITTASIFILSIMNFCIKTLRITTLKMT